MIENIGIVGGGQLGRMLTEAAIPLGYHVTVVEAGTTSPAQQVGAEQITGGLKDTEAIDRLIAATDVATWEIEHIAASHLADRAAGGANIESSPATLEIIQDKLLQKRMLQNAGIPVAPFSEYPFTASSFLGGGPYVVKSRKGGYDGRGNLVLDSLDDGAITNFFGDQPVYVEQKLDFEKELSVIAARGKSGDVKTYPVVQTIHENNICNLVLAPAPVEPDILEKATDIAHATMKVLEGAGVFAIEMFVVNGEVLVNEIAPRVHNSGHHTIEANVTSQFEQHIRAITGMPLGSTAMRAPAAAMINILGTREEPLHRDGLDAVLALPDTHPHFYGKSSRPARKIGHITILGASTAEVSERANTARKLLSI